MADVTILSVTATNGSNLSNLPIKNGQMTFIQDKHKLAFDLDDKRVIYREIIDIATEAGRTSLLAPVSGCYYFVVETAVLWTYRNGEWVQMTAPPGKNETLHLSESEYNALTAEELAAYYNAGIRMVFIEDDHENLVPGAIGANGAIYNGCGYMSGYRLNSSGAVVSADCAVVTGYIPFTQGAKICISGGFNPASHGGCYVAAYDASFNLLVIGYLEVLIANSSGSSVCTENNNHIFTIATAAFKSNDYVNAFASAAYIRVSLVPCVGHELSVHYE